MFSVFIVTSVIAVHTNSVIKSVLADMVYAYLQLQKLQAFSKSANITMHKTA